MIGDFNDFNDFKDFKVVKVSILLTPPQPYSRVRTPVAGYRKIVVRANYVKILIIRARVFATFSLSRTGKAKIYFCFAAARKGRRKFNILLENKRKFDSN